MKKLLKVLALSLVLVIAFTLTACANSFPKLEKALNKAGYATIETSSEGEDMQEESEIPVTPHYFSNKDSISVSEILKLTTVIVYEFKSTDDMIEFYKDSDTMQGLIKDIEEDGSAKDFYDSLVEKGLAKGNCLIIAIGLDATNVANIVKEA